MLGLTEFLHPSGAGAALAGAAPETVQQALIQARRRLEELSQ